MSHQSNRRIFLKTGAATIAVTAGATGIWANTRTPTKALQPWKDAGQSFGDVRLDALAYAILAPNPHNRQPWRAELVGQDSLNVYCDLDRRLPATDPYDRQINIGLGCFLELLRMAAAKAGFKADVTPFPEGAPAEMARLDNRPIAHVTFTAADVKADTLLEAVFERRSNKEPYTTAPVSAQTLNSLLSDFNHSGPASTPNIVQGTVGQSEVEALKQTIYEGMAVEFGLQETLQESTDLMRFGKKAIEASPDGIDIGGAFMEALTLAGILTHENFSDPKGAMVLDYLARTKTTFDTTQGFVWVTTSGAHPNSRAAQLRVGADYVRLNLKATTLGLAMQPVSQTLQEYPAMAPLYRQVHQQINVKQPARLQMLARIGYAPTPSPSPRWPVESLLLV